MGLLAGTPELNPPIAVDNNAVHVSLTPIERCSGICRPLEGPLTFGEIGPLCAGIR
jgi:hypothetical protein